MSVNNCDGCRAGHPLVDGVHRPEGSKPWDGSSMRCTADRYGVEPFDSCEPTVTQASQMTLPPRWMTDEEAALADSARHDLERASENLLKRQYANASMWTAVSVPKMLKLFGMIRREHDAERAGPNDGWPSLCRQDPCSGTHDTSDWKHAPRDTTGKSWIGLTDRFGNKLARPAAGPNDSTAAEHGVSEQSASRHEAANETEPPPPDGSLATGDVLERVKNPRPPTETLRRVMAQAAPDGGQLPWVVMTDELAARAVEAARTRIADLHKRFEPQSMSAEALVYLEGRLAAAERERDLFERHAKEGWELANRRTRQWKGAERDRDEAIARERERCLRWTDFAYNESAMTGGQLHEAIRDGKPAP